MTLGPARLPLLIGLAAATACAKHKSFILVEVLSTSGEIRGVAQLLVDVQSGPNTDFLRYPTERTADLVIAEKTAVTFSVSFTTGHKGQIEVGVAAVDKMGMLLGYGTAAAAIYPGGTNQVTVRVTRGAAPPGGDGGAPDAATCQPAAPSPCGASGTCFVACRGDAGTGMCTTGGTRQPGETCERNEDCAPGSQCFSFACAAAAPIRTCLRFCADANDCGGGLCSTPVQCADTPTGFRACSRPCDPTGPATAGCAAGLFCFLFDGELPDCDCRAQTRVGGDGAACTDTRGCQPGFHCVSMGGATRCRALCRLDGTGARCTAGLTCTKLVDPEFKIWGACL